MASMNKRILFFEQTDTFQAIFKEVLKDKPFELFFQKNPVLFFKSIPEIKPDLILINAANASPSGFAFMRILYESKEFKNIPVRMYAGKHYAFDRYYEGISHAEIFYINRNNIMESILKLIHLEEDNDAAEAVDFDDITLNDEKLFELSNKVWQKDIQKNAIDLNLYNMLRDITEFEKVVQDFLSMTANFLRVPMVALCMKDEENIEIDYIQAENIPESALQDFLKVCKSDFEERLMNSNVTSPVINQLKNTVNLERYYLSDIPLAVYKYLPLKNSSGNEIGTVHIIRNGNFSESQLELFEYTVGKAELLFTNAMMLKKKLFFEQNIRKAFTRFVPEQIIDDLVKKASENKEEPVGEKREVAILFSDIRSFTNISEANRPEVIVSFLNRYFTTMVNIIKKHGGTVDKFIGDAIMALFGTPISYEDNARRAVRAAYEMREALESVPLEDLVLPNGMKFDIGIGIHYGDVIAGSLGSKDKTDYTVIGDNVNLASRLEGLTKTYGTQVLVSQSVKNDIGRNETNEKVFSSEFCFRYLDDVKVKGKANAVPIYAVDRTEDEFPSEYKDAYQKGVSLYKQGLFTLAKQYFEAALKGKENDKAALLMLSRCNDFIENPPENWDGAIAFKTK